MRYFLALALIISIGGCGGDRDKAINKDKDKPVPADAVKK